MAASSSRPPVWLLAALPAVGVFASSVYLPSIPAMATELQVPGGQIQFTITVYLAAMSACMLVIGPLSDKLGRRRISLTMLALFMLGSVAAMLATNVALLLAARVVQGAGASGGVVLARSMLRDAYDDTEAARAGATMSMSIAVVPMLAPLYGGWVQQHLGWRANLLSIALLVGLLWLTALRRLPETLPVARRRTDGGHLMLVGYAQLLRMRAFLTYSLPVAFGAVATFAYQTEAPLLLIRMLHVPASQYGIYGALPAVGFVGGSFLTRHWAGQVDRRRLMQAGGGLCLVAGAIMAGLALAFAPTPWTIAAPMLLFGLGNGLVLPNGSFGSMSAAPLLIGASSALSGCLRMGAGALGSLLATALPSGSVVALGLLIALASAVGIVCGRSLGHDLAPLQPRTRHDDPP